MGSKKRYIKSRAKKRKFQSNQFSEEPEKEVVGSVSESETPKCRPRPIFDERPCASSKKIRLDEGLIEDVPTSDESFIVVNMTFLQQLVSLFGASPSCTKSSLEVENQLGFKMGFCYKIKIFCKLCHWSEDLLTSKVIEQGTPGQKPYEVNLRMLIAFREIGQGLGSMQTFCRCLNMPPPMSKSAYNKTVANLWDRFTDAAIDSLKTAANETKALLGNGSEENPLHCQVSIDGTWQKRGYSSLNGIVTTISRDCGKCIDYQVVTKSCKACERWSTMEGTDQYDIWKASHKCPINHFGSSGTMESYGAIEIYNRSVDFHNLRYTGYIGDGDSSFYASVVKAAPYGDIEIKKMECVGHIQKRMGTRLRNLRKTLKGTKLSDGKTISGQGRLTEKIINRMQNYYGLAIRQNIDNRYAMKKAVWAIFFHMIENDNEEDRHKCCPRSEDSWCKYQADQITGKSTYRDKTDIPLAIKEHLFPVFKDLASDELLRKCLHGQTQNANEALNKLIWSRCPKTNFASRSIVEIATASAVLYFNDGSSGILRVLQKLNIDPGAFTKLASCKVDKSRIKNMEYKSKKAS